MRLLMLFQSFELLGEYFLSEDVVETPEKEPEKTATAPPTATSLVDVIEETADEMINKRVKRMAGRAIKKGLEKQIGCELPIDFDQFERVREVTKAYMINSWVTAEMVRALYQKEFGEEMTDATIRATVDVGCQSFDELDAFTMAMMEMFMLAQMTKEEASQDAGKEKVTEKEDDSKKEDSGEKEPPRAKPIQLDG
ncbi:hypothetical protein ES703_71007 [subsurface metagenome]